jgi:hypothetical protein
MLMANDFQCPNCFAVWSIEEIDWNNCDACGYPNHEEEEEEFDPDPIEDDGDDDNERYHPHDSRNL